MFQICSRLLQEPKMFYLQIIELLVHVSALAQEKFRELYIYIFLSNSSSLFFAEEASVAHQFPPWDK